MGGVRVVTFNTWCRSWGMEAGAQEGIPTSTVEDRAHLIAKRILDSPQQFDVVCLNEVFDEDAREIFEDALLPSYPHAVLKADAGSPGDGVLKLAAAAMVSQVPVFGWLAALGLAAWSVPDLKAAEDSGLMMFSRLPFDTMTAPPGFEGVFPGAFPVVTYAPYADSEGLDGFAAKGVVYAKLLRPGGEPLHLLMSHTQADSTSSIGEHRKTRAKQFKQLAELAHKMIGAPPFDEEVLFCGDLNVNGTRNAGGARPEWDMVFDTPGSFLTDELHDVWTHEQRAQDLNNPGKPLPIEDPGMTTHLQRLDYMLRPPDDGSGRRLATQHVAIDYELARGTTDIPYTSDHLPVRIDLHYRRDHNTAWTAELIQKAQMAPDFYSPNMLLTEGEMHWYRIDEPGGYGFSLEGEPRVGFEVYTADNFSVPVQSFTQVAEPAQPEGPPLSRYALPSAPFFIRVFDRQRSGETLYRLHVHRYEGRSPKDAIPLLHEVPTSGLAQENTPHSLNRPETPFDDTDCVWYLATFDQPPPGRGSIRSTVSVSAMDRPAFGVLAVAQDPGGGLQLLDEAAAGGDPVKLPFEHRDRGHGFLLVKREDSSFSALQFTIELASDVTYLYTVPAGSPNQPGSELQRGLDQGYLVCTDETDGAFGLESGSDDISINVSADGTLVVHVDNKDALQFDDDTEYKLVFPVLRWAGNLKFELVELDDLSPADRASVTIPQLPGAEQGAERVPRRDGAAIFAIFRISFGDGHYRVGATLSRQPPPI